MTPVCPNRPMLAGAVLIALLFLVAFAAVRREGPAQDRPAITHVETAPPASKPGGIL